MNGLTVHILYNISTNGFRKTVTDSGRKLHPIGDVVFEVIDANVKDMKKTTSIYEQ